uniref:SPK domain-containing protein n=1 Tax=Caenorhabditis tropicalis TaxID=1561998 RepID=A0A1I7UJY6_9PELO
MSSSTVEATEDDDDVICLEFTPRKGRSPRLRKPEYIVLREPEPEHEPEPTPVQAVQPKIENDPYLEVIESWGGEPIYVNSDRSSAPELETFGGETKLPYLVVNRPIRSISDYIQWVPYKLREMKRNYHETFKLSPCKSQDRIRFQLVKRDGSLTLPSMLQMFRASGFEHHMVYILGLRFDTVNKNKFNYTGIKWRCTDKGFMMSSMEMRIQLSGGRLNENGLFFHDVKFSASWKPLRTFRTLYNIILLPLHRQLVPVITVYTGNGEFLREFRMDNMQIITVESEDFYDHCLGEIEKDVEYLPVEMRDKHGRPLSIPLAECEPESKEDEEPTHRQARRGRGRPRTVPVEKPVTAPIKKLIEDTRKPVNPTVVKRARNTAAVSVENIIKSWSAAPIEPTVKISAKPIEKKIKPNLASIEATTRPTKTTVKGPAVAVSLAIKKAAIPVQKQASLNKEAPKSEISPIVEKIETIPSSKEYKTASIEDPISRLISIIVEPAKPTPTLDKDYVPTIPVKKSPEQPNLGPIEVAPNDVSKNVTLIEKDIVPVEQSLLTNKIVEPINCPASIGKEIQSFPIEESVESLVVDPIEKETSNPTAPIEVSTLPLTEHNVPILASTECTTEPVEEAIEVSIVEFEELNAFDVVPLEIVIVSPGSTESQVENKTRRRAQRRERKRRRTACDDQAVYDAQRAANGLRKRNPFVCYKEDEHDF